MRSNGNHSPPMEDRHLRVLFVEDNRADLELCRLELVKAGFSLRSDATDSREQFCELIEGKEFDVILADYGLPGWTGQEALEILRQAHKPIPFILVTGSLGDEKAVECIKGGASNYVLKEHLARLPVAVEQALEEQRLRRAKRQAEEELRKYATELESTNRELQEFASIASHDLQEPLRKVVAFGERLAEHAGERLDETGKDYLQRMQSAATRMAALIDALLTYSRLSTRAQPFERVDLTQTMLGVMVDLEVRIRETHARVETTVLPQVMADRIQMHQLLLNLLSNALKFSRPGVPPELWVGWRLLPGNRCEITVADNGIGFEEEYAERIFRPFQRLHGRGEYEGTGMGLAICRKIVTRHGGSIVARSEPGKGSTFVVELPVTQPSQEAPCPSSNTQQPLSSSPKTTTTISS